LRSPWLSLAAASVAAASLVVPWAGLLAGLAWFLLLAARFDNRTGSCFTVAMLVVLVLATLAMLTGFPALCPLNLSRRAGAPRASADDPP
jgi:hypothetical protein